MKKGKFITFEGPEGSGKTTQLLLLAKYLKEKGVPFISTREPGGTEISEKLRTILLESKGLDMSDRTELLLMVASRAQNTDEVILPALRKGQIVVCDRYSDSTLAYQSYGRGLDLEDAWRMCLFSTAGLMPDMTFLIDIDPAKGLERALLAEKPGKAANTHDRMESEDLEFHLRVRRGFLELAEKEPKRFRVIDGTGPIESIHAEVVRYTQELIGEKWHSKTS